MTSVSITNGAETFTFADGMVEDSDTTISSELDKNVMPVSGPMNNQGYDFSGVEKLITIRGNLRDVSSSVSNTQNIKDKLIMKYWLEAVLNGNQANALTFTSNQDSYSVELSSSNTFQLTDTVSGAAITLPATFTATKIKSSKVTFKEEKANPQLIPFTMELWVCGI